MFKKILAALLVAGTVLTLTACNKENTKTPDNDPDTKTEQPSGTGSETGTQTGTEPDEIDYESGLSTEKYDGYNYRILVRKGWLEGQYQEESQEDVIADAIYRRNKEVEERFGITISGFESSSNDYEFDALNSILAGDDAYDIIFAHSRAAFYLCGTGRGYEHTRH